MDNSPTISTEQASKVRKVLFRIAFVAAMFLAVILLLDGIFHHRIVAIFVGADWYFLVGSWPVLAFLLAVLLTQFHDMVLPPSRVWSDSDHVTFIGLYWIFAFFFVPIFYIVAVYSMIHDYGGGGE